MNLTALKVGVLEPTGGINGECVVDGDVLTITNVEGRYNMFNGVWKKNVNLEEYINNPPASVLAADVI